MTWSLWNGFLSRVSAAGLQGRFAPPRTGSHPGRDDLPCHTDDKLWQMLANNGKWWQTMENGDIKMTFILIEQGS